MYKNRYFDINEEVVSNHNYSYIPKGTRVRIRAITPTKSLQFYGINGSYNPDNFYRYKGESSQGEKKAESEKKFFALEVTSDIFDSLQIDENITNLGNNFIGSDTYISYGTLEEIKKSIDELDIGIEEFDAHLVVFEVKYVLSPKKKTTINFETKVINS